MDGWAADSCHRWLTWLVLCEEGRGPRVGDISMGGSTIAFVPSGGGLTGSPRRGCNHDPLLFFLYIDDLRSVVPETVKVALVADDVSLISSHHN